VGGEARAAKLSPSPSPRGRRCRSAAAFTARHPSWTRRCGALITPSWASTSRWSQRRRARGHHELDSPSRTVIASRCWASSWGVVPDHEPVGRPPRGPPTAPRRSRRWLRIAVLAAALLSGGFYVVGTPPTRHRFASALQSAMRRAPSLRRRGPRGQARADVLVADAFRRQRRRACCSSHGAGNRASNRAAEREVPGGRARARRGAADAETAGQGSAMPSVCSPSSRARTWSGRRTGLGPYTTRTGRHPLQDEPPARPVMEDHAFDNDWVRARPASLPRAS